MLELDTNLSETGTMDLNYGENTLHFEFVESKLSASVCNDEGEFTIQSHNLQKELRSISNLSTLEAYFENAFFKVKELDDGYFKLEVNQKGYGGSRLEQKYGNKIIGKQVEPKYRLNVDCYKALGTGALSLVQLAPQTTVLKMAQGSVSLGKAIDYGSKCRLEPNK
jgi:hypothetical protein